MGLSTDVNKHDKEVLKNAPPGTRTNSLEYTEQELKREHVIITDMMASPNGVFTWSKPDTKPSDDVPMTGLDYWEQFKKFMLTRMGMKPRYMAICVDDRKYVPVEKEKTQLNRQKYSKVENPIKLDEEEEISGSLFCDRGFKCQTGGHGRLTPEPIPPSLCRGSSHLRKPLARYLLGKLEAYLRDNLSTCTSFWGTSLIFDYDGFQFVLIEFDQTTGIKVSWHDYVKGFPVYGEADGKVVAWANFFMDKYNIQIETTDTDIKGWATELARIHKEKKYTTSIHWITKDIPTKKLVITELRMSTEYLRKSMGFETNRHLLVWMIVMKTDYWDKSDLTDGFGKMDIAKAIREPRCSNLIPKISYKSLDSPSLLTAKEASTLHYNELLIVKSMLVALLAGLKYTLGSERMKNKPDDNKLNELAKRMWWHIGYWEMNMGISLEIIKTCNERYHKNKNKQQKTVSDTEMQLEQKKLIAPLIPPLVESI